MKLIHIADLHLGRCFNTNDHNYNHLRREELFETFENVLRYGRDKGIYHVLISGDFYEDDTCTYKEIKRIVSIIEMYAEINIYIIAGNHDPLNEQSWYTRITWPENVNILIDENDKAIVENIEIYGLSWRQKLWKNEKNFEFDLDNSKRNILMLHGDIKDLKSDYFAIDVEKYLNLGFDYLALGHIHKPEIQNKYSYPGSLEPMKFANNEKHGMVVLDANDEAIKVEFVEFAKRNFNTIELIVDRDEKIDQIEENCRKMMSDIGSKEDIYRIRFKGVLKSTCAERIKGNLEKYFYKVEFENKAIGVTEILDCDNPIFEKVQKELSKETYSPEMKKRIEEIVLTALIKTGRA